MFSMSRFLVIVLAVLAGAAPCLALTPAEVMVVANSDCDDSLEIAKTYMSARGIPDKNLLLIKTTKDYEVSRKAYDEEIRKPILAALKPRADIRCLCMIYGVPVRVARKDAQAPVSAVPAASIQIAQYRLALDYKLLGSVGRDFTAPRTAELSPLSRIFETPLPDPQKPLKRADELLKDIDVLLGMRQAEVAEIKDPAKKKIATQQLMALEQDIYGLSGLIKLIKTAKPENAPDVADLQKRLDQAMADADKIAKKGDKGEDLAARLALQDKAHGAAAMVSLASGTKEEEKGKETDAAVDSELALILWDDYQLEGPLINGLNWQKQKELLAKHVRVKPVMMTSRLDGPSKLDVLRMIENSVKVEKTGLKGTLYIDTASKLPAAPDYNIHLLKLMAFVAADTRIKTVKNEKQTVFPAGSCPDAALYVGWYSLAQYVPAFEWNPGAVGWHIASYEAMHLRNPKSQEWCVKMIQNGVVATIGAVNEPYLGSFPLPEEFFPLLMTGKWTLAECYWRTTPTTSWRMMLLADPLYNPFQSQPALKPNVLPLGLTPEIAPSASPNPK